MLASAAHGQGAGSSGFDDAEVLGCGEGVSGSTVGMDNDWGNRAGDVVYRVAVGEGVESVDLSLCGGGTDYWSYLWLLDADRNEVARDGRACGYRGRITTELMEAGQNVSLERGEGK